MYNKKQIKAMFLNEVKDKIVEEPRYNELIESEISKLYDLSIKSIIGLDEEDTTLLRDRFGIIEERIQKNETLREKYHISRSVINSRVVFSFRLINEALRKKFFDGCSKPELLNLKLEYLDLSGDLCDLLKYVRICTVKDLIQNTKQDLFNKDIEISRKDIKEITNTLYPLGLYLGDVPIFSQEEIDSLSLEEKMNYHPKSLRIPHFGYTDRTRIKTLQELTESTKKDLLKISGVGPKGVIDIREALNKYGLDIKDAESLEEQTEKEQMIKARKKMIASLNMLINNTEKPVPRDSETLEILKMLEEYSNITILDLDDLETSVFRKRIGIETGKPMDFNTIAKEYELDEESVKIIFCDGLAKIREYVNEKRASKDIIRQRDALKKKLQELEKALEKKKEEAKALKKAYEDTEKALKERTRILSERKYLL